MDYYALFNTRIYNWEISSGENQELPQKEYNKMDKQENKQTVGSNSEELKERKKKSSLADAAKSTTLYTPGTR